MINFFVLWLISYGLLGMWFVLLHSVFHIKMTLIFDMKKRKNKKHYTQFISKKKSIFIFM
jgi:hypothetical protein